MSPGPFSMNAQEQRSAADRKERPFAIQRLIALLEGSSVFVILLVLWQLAVWAFEPPAYLLPAPKAVWHDIWNPALRWPTSIAITVEEILGGFAISAVA